jgi:hypothetical protein
MGIYDNYNGKRIALVMIAISAAVLLAAISITDFSILVFAYQQQQEQQQLQPPQKFIAQQSASSTDPIINQSSSTASLLFEHYC